MQGEGIAFLVLVLILAGGVYLLPAIVAGARQHRQKAPIFILTLFLGWTVLGWIGALAWACSTDVNEN